jgi:hypothetical protein
MKADDLVPNPMASVTHAITINAAADRVWPWLAQMGAGRAGWYSWDFIDNGGIASARSILKEHQQLQIGQIFPAIPGADDAFVLHDFEEGKGLVLCVPSVSGSIIVSWEFLLEPKGKRTTRLVVRSRISDKWLEDSKNQQQTEGGPILIQRIYGIMALIPPWVVLPFALFGHRIMEVKMLRGIKHRAETAHR